MRHLSPEQAVSYLRLGKVLEQWLGRVTTAGGEVLRWVQVKKQADDDYLVSLFEATESDRARDDLWGLYSVGLDEDGDPEQIFAAGKNSSFGSEQQAIARVAELGGTADRFVNEGFIQDEYLSSIGE
jgi:hypothetical protein